MLQLEVSDRRARRTKRALTQSLASLIIDYGYDNISIRQIAVRADIAYSTFFRHFASKQDLLMDMLAHAVHQLNEYMSESSLRDSDGYLIFKHVQENVLLYRSLMGCQSSFDVRGYMRSLIATDLSNSCCDMSLAGFDQQIPAEVAAYHKANALWGLLEWWLEHEMPYPPAKMAQMYNQLVKNGSPPTAANWRR